MRQNKGHSRAPDQRTFLFGFLLLISVFIIPGIPEVRSNVCPENLIVKIYPGDIFKVNFAGFRTLNVKRDLPAAPNTKKPFTRNTGSPVPSDQCFFYEGHRSIADRGPESALPAFSGIFSGYPLNEISLISHIPFILFSSWTGNCTKIRPPPVF